MARIMKQGKCGDNLTWTLDNEGLLTISGEGKMENYGFFDSPFKNTNITKVKILHGVTSIGYMAFSGCKALT
ncbi:MAG: leucine-rich repeat domain-containing protein, partial [Paludibacteraceae bacterium]|nr:leucine-rich repeat domain-containing protein [Paludibacteraceae bacterium]